MKQVILAIAIAVLIVCGIVGFVTLIVDSAAKKQKSEIQNGSIKAAYQVENPEKWYPVHTYKHDGCEYVVFGYGDGAWGGHKGNCSNPIHQNN